MANIYFVLIISFSSVLLSYVEGFEHCGSSLCKSDQVCDSSGDGDICYNRSARIECNDGITYCYKPRICCGVRTCCPADSICCGLNTCCPKNSVCCSPNFCCEHGTTCCGYQTCCGAGSHCDSGTCIANSGGEFRVWYILFFLFPLLSLIIIIIRRRRRAALLRAAAAQGNVVVAVPVQIRTENYGYDQGPIAYGMPPPQFNNTEQPMVPNGPPPPYSDVVDPKA